MRDILYDAAVKYGELKNTTYEILLGRRGKLYKLMLHFPSESFFHLVGFQHLKDIVFPSTNKERIYKEILKKNITLHTIQKSAFYERYFIEERIVNLCCLEKIIENNNFMYKINPKEYLQYTTIKADYVSEHKIELTNILYFFVVYEKTTPKFENDCRGCSFLKKHRIDFTRGTAKTTVLKICRIEFINKPHEKKDIIYISNSYNEVSA